MVNNRARRLVMTRLQRFNLWESARSLPPHPGPTAVGLEKLPRETRRLPPLLPSREERVGVRRGVLTPLNSPHPNPLPVRRGEGEVALSFMSFLNSTAVRPGHLAWGEGESPRAGTRCLGGPICTKPEYGAPSPRGEGWGEGDRSARSRQVWGHRARPSVFGLRISFGFRFSDFGF